MSGDELAASKQFRTRYTPLVRKAVSNTLPSDYRHLQDDAFQQTWFDLSRFRKPIDHPNSFIYKVAANACRNLVRSESRHQLHLVQQVEESEAGFDHSDNGSGARGTELGAIVNEFVEVIGEYLTQDQERVLRLALEDHTQRQIADAMCRSVGWVNGQLKRIKVIVKSVISNLDNDDPDDGGSSGRGSLTRSPREGTKDDSKARSASISRENAQLLKYAGLLVLLSPAFSEDPVGAEEPRDASLLPIWASTAAARTTFISTMCRFIAPKGDGCLGEWKKKEDSSGEVSAPEFSKRNTDTSFLAAAASLAALLIIGLGIRLVGTVGAREVVPAIFAETPSTFHPDAEVLLSVFQGRGGTAELTEDDTVAVEGNSSLRCTVRASGNGFAGWFVSWGDESQAGDNSFTRDMSVYRGGSLVFWVKTPIDLSLGVRSGNVKPGSETSEILLSAAHAGEPSDTWQRVCVPLSVFEGGPGGADLTRMKVFFKVESNTDSRGTGGEATTFWIDDVHWEVSPCGRSP